MELRGAAGADHAPAWPCMAPPRLRGPVGLRRVAYLGGWGGRMLQRKIFPLCRLRHFPRARVEGRVGMT
jgi:hypothetical protein